MKHRPTKRAVVSIVVSVVVVAIVVAAMAFAVTRDTGGADAITVNGQSVSQATVNQELGALASKKVVTPSTAGAVTADVGTAWLTSHVAAVALEQLFAENDVTLTAKQHAQILQQLRKQYHGLPSSAENVIINVSVANSLLGDKLNGSDGVAKALKKAMQKLDVSVDPKYGRWVRARAQVCPVTGCPAVSAQSSAGG
jgi:hypothetical protein